VGEAKPFEAEKLIVASLASAATLARPGFWQQVLLRLSDSFGPIDYASRPIPFAFTHYYDEELGAPLVRRFVAFERLVDPQALARIKLATNALEEELGSRPAAGGARLAGPRSINLDPGLLSLSRFVLASTKDSSHRIPLADGIFAEITLQYQRPTFRPLPWTYPDYRSEEVHEVLLEIRRMFKARRRNPPRRGGLSETDACAGPHPPKGLPLH
jgi:hypothetical protein